MKFRWIGRLDRQQKLVRLGSFLWGTHPADAGHRNRLSLSVRPALFHFSREARAEYARRREEHYALVARECRAHDIPYVAAPIERAPGEILRGWLRKQGGRP